ncbi:unnamed protein product [Symbiodinium natans]|uniref:Uncharacterized protein n=1 Tax=Symbiodinium natans TaxID=878477 RepID=A0A812RJ56_9DINO|nr:unnamed protein product [Symbiodinium natans]
MRPVFRACITGLPPQSAPASPGKLALADFCARLVSLMLGNLVRRKLRFVGRGALPGPRLWNAAARPSNSENCGAARVSSMRGTHSGVARARPAGCKMRRRGAR